MIGNFAANPAGEEVLQDADVLLSVGTHFRSNETKSYKLVLPGCHVQIDLDKAPRRSYPVTLWPPRRSGQDACRADSGPSGRLRD